MKPSVRASFVGISALAVVLLLAPGAAAASPDAQQSGLKVDWHQANSSGFGAPTEFLAGAYANGTYVVSSDANNGWRIWASSDALNWSVAWSGADAPGYIVPGGPGFVAWADGILLSKNGRHWTPANEDVPKSLIKSSFPQLSSVAGVVVAFPDSGHGYWSADGHTWHAIAAGSGPQRPLTLAGDGTHLWALTGGHDFDRGTSSPVEVWVTADGQHWTNTAQLPSSHKVSGLSAAFGPAGGVAIAGSRAWYSADDVHWHIAKNTPTLTNQGRDDVKAVIADVSGFIVTARRDEAGCVLDPAQSRGLTWTSVDGKVWRKMSSTGWKGREIDQMFVTGRTLFGIGVGWTHESSSGLVWRAQLPNVASDNAPPPDPIPNPGRQGC